MFAFIPMAMLAVASSASPLAIDPNGTALKWGPCPPPFTGKCELTILRGDPAQANADVMLRLPAGYRLPPHKHSSAERMILVGGKLQVHYQGSPTQILRPGHYAYGPAGLAHDGRCVGPQPCTLFIAFEGPVDVVAVDGPIR